LVDAAEEKETRGKSASSEEETETAGLLESGASIDIRSSYGT